MGLTPGGSTACGLDWYAEGSKDGGATCGWRIEANGGRGGEDATVIRSPAPDASVRRADTLAFGAAAAATDVVVVVVVDDAAARPGRNGGECGTNWEVFLGCGGPPGAWVTPGGERCEDEKLGLGTASPPISGPAPPGGEKKTFKLGFVSLPVSSSR